MLAIFGHKADSLWYRWSSQSLWRIGGNFQSRSQDKQEEAVMMVY